MKKLICCLLCLLLAGCSNPQSNTTDPTPTETESPYPEPDKLIAITFDDGPNNSYMPMVLDALEEFDVPATFFVIGNKITEQNAPVIKRAYDMGCEIGNHGYSHIRMSGLSKDEMQEEVSKVQTAVKEITGEEPKLFRPPFLDANRAMGQQINMPFITGVAAQDGTAETNRKERYENVMKGVYDGCIVLMHCGGTGGETVWALYNIIPELRMQGYEFVTVSELFARVGYTPETGTGKLIINNLGL